MLDIFSNPNVLVSYLLSIPGVLLALSVHECAHGYVSYKLGDPTAKNLGRLTLNPIKHIDILGLICMVFFRFGWAKPVPVNARYYKKPRRDMALVRRRGTDFQSSHELYRTFSAVSVLSDLFLDGGLSRFLRRPLERRDLQSAAGNRAYVGKGDVSCLCVFPAICTSQRQPCGIQSLADSAARRLAHCIYFSADEDIFRYHAV